LSVQQWVEATGAGQLNSAELLQDGPRLVVQLRAGHLLQGQ
jgi:hypothetical protein